MKKLYLPIVWAMLFVVVFAPGAAADNPATFTVTVSIAAEANIDVVQGGPVDFGVMNAGDVAVSSQAVVIRNSGSGASQTYSLSLSNSADWTAVTTTPGVDQFRLCGAFDSNGTLSWNPANHALTTNPVAATGTRFAGDETGAGVPYNAIRHLYLRMETPQSTSTSAQQSIQVIINASVD